MRFWSISTTVRNPERIRDFLNVLEIMEGEKWTKENQIKYQVLLIQNKVYGDNRPQFYNSLTQEQKEWLDSGSHQITYEQAQEILDYKNYVGGGDMRGRQSFNPLRKMGLAFLDDKNIIRISDFGKYFLQDDYDLGEIFFRSFLKWQYPNPYANKYKKEDGYNIKPFISTLHLISNVNNICRSKGFKEKGVSRLEFAMFFVSLSNYIDINFRAEKLIEFRKYFESINELEEKNSFVEEYFEKNFSEYESFENAKEYTDNIIRYFRITRYINIRGNGWYIDLEPRRAVEIQALIDSDNASAKEFVSKQDYILYLGDLNSPILPWENKEKLKKLISLLMSEINRKYKELSITDIRLPEIPHIDKAILDVEILKSTTNKLRNFLRKLGDIETNYYSQSIENIMKYIETLSNIFTIARRRPVELEKNIYLGLNALNDALEIKPNYPVGDDNEPTFTAPSNKPDIECFYELFNAICEVTLLTNRSQWYNEGQPVMRHVRDFEDNYQDKDTYCLFIAPKIHRDTINTFWMAVKYEYEGKAQKIIPLSIKQFVSLLKQLIILKKNGVFLTHYKIKELLDEIINLTDSVDNSNEWLSNIPNVIENWKKSLIDIK